MAAHTEPNDRRVTQSPSPGSRSWTRRPWRCQAGGVWHYAACVHLGRVHLGRVHLGRVHLGRVHLGLRPPRAAFTSGRVHLGPRPPRAASAMDHGRHRRALAMRWMIEHLLGEHESPARAAPTAAPVLGRSCRSQPPPAAPLLGSADQKSAGVPPGVSRETARGVFHVEHAPRTAYDDGQRERPPMSAAIRSRSSVDPTSTTIRPLR
jgi:hypothetical protein